MDTPLTDADRFPLLTPAGRERLLRLQEHPHAPRYNHRCGDRLDAAALRRVREYGEAFRRARRGWDHREVPDWLERFSRFCLADVPYYRPYGEPGSFFDLPTTCRADLVREPWSFVPDSQPLDDLILYRSSQTTGECVTVLSHPEVPARDLPLLEELLARRGVALRGGLPPERGGLPPVRGGLPPVRGGGERVSIVMACAQTHTITYPAVLSYLGEAGFAKINLNPADWRDPDDRVKFLDDCDPELYSGDPIAFHELLRLPLRTHPRALLSTAMTLLPGFRAVLEAHFGCPVFDLYALNETGIVTADDGGGHAVLPHDLYVEVLDPDGAPCPPGERGEVTVSGGNNPFMPLLRYRTGDYAAMSFDGPVPRLEAFEPREPVEFRGAGGRAVPGHAVTAALRDFPIAAFTLRQADDGGLLFRSRGEGVSEAALREALGSLFGAAHAGVRRDGCPLEIAELPPPYEWGGKLLQYEPGVTPPAA
jgi:phenylacetate-CoA ligase